MQFMHFIIVSAGLNSFAHFRHHDIVWSISSQETPKRTTQILNSSRCYFKG